MACRRLLSHPGDAAATAAAAAAAAAGSAAASAAAVAAGGSALHRHEAQVNAAGAAASAAARGDRGHMNSTDHWRGGAKAAIADVDESAYRQALMFLADYAVERSY